MSILESTRKMTTNEKMCYDMGYAQGKQDAVPMVRGEWKKDGEYPWLLNCSGCGYSTERGTNHCPNCGAKADDNHDQPYAAGNK